MHDDVKTSILYFYSQDKDKNEYLLKSSETYEPLNVNFVDLYQVKIYLPGLPRDVPVFS